MARIAIIGLDTLGASLGLALRQDRVWANICGYDRAEPTQHAAKRSGAIQVGADTPMDAVRDADLVVLALPPLEVTEVLGDIAASLKPGAVVTDTAPTKSYVLAAAERVLPSSVSFVGGHPIVTPMGSRPEDGLIDLFKGQPWFLVPGPHVQDDAVAVVTSMVDVAGGRPYFVDALEHDSWAAGVGQLPVLLASALALATGTSSAWRDMQRLAEDEFHVATQVISQNGQRAREALLTNAAELNRWLDTCVEQLTSLRARIAAGDSEGLGLLLEQSANIRKQWLAAARHGFPDDTIPAMPEIRSSWTSKIFQRRRPE